MENAVKALEYAFAIFMFIIALSISILMISEVRTSADIMFSYIDTKQTYVDAKIANDELTNTGNIKYNGRIVNVETIVPTLYRDYKENYIIEFYDKEGRNIIRFDLSEENRTRQLWTGTPEVDVKKRMDLIVNGGGPSGSGIINNQMHYLDTDIAFQKEISVVDKKTIVTEGMYKYCEGKKFVEEYAYVLEENEDTLETDITKIIIRYTEVDN